MQEVLIPMGAEVRPFKCVTHKRWIAEHFADLGAIVDHGFDLDPATAMDTVWWAPGAWVASAANAGVRLPLMSCGPRWLEDLHRPRYTGRTVSNMRVDESVDWFERVVFRKGGSINFFVKLPEAKLDSFPAGVHEINRHWGTTIGQYHLPAHTMIQFQGVVDFRIEARFWISHREITAESPYRIGNMIWGWAGFGNASQRLMATRTYAGMREFAERVAHEVDAPPGYVLDIGMTKDGPLVVEANAAWSSGPYDGDPEGIFKAIVASHDFEGKYPEWAWRHSAVFDRARPLKLVSA